MLNSGVKCIQILAHSRAIFIVLCLLLVFHFIVRVASCSTVARLLLGHWCLICGCPIVTYRCPCRLMRTTTRARRWLGGTPGTGRAGTCLPVLQAPLSNASSNMMATSAVICHNKWQIIKEGGNTRHWRFMVDAGNGGLGGWTAFRSNILYENK